MRGTIKVSNSVCKRQRGKPAHLHKPEMSKRKSSKGECNFSQILNQELLKMKEV